MHPDETIAKSFRLTALQTTGLRRLGLTTIRDLLYHFPARYEQAGVSATSARLVAGEKVTLYGTLTKLEAKRLWKSRRTATEGWFEDASGRVKVLWFNQPYIAKMAPQGVPVKITGTVAGKDKPYITNPDVEALPKGFTPTGLFSSADSGVEDSSQALFPIYPESRGITSLWFYHAIGKIIHAGAHQALEDPLPRYVRARLHLPELHAALVLMHRPEKTEHAEAARKRFAFEEIFTLQTERALESYRNAAQPSFFIANTRTHAERFLASLPFQPTRAQKKAADDIRADFDPPTGGARPMARLLEGDVGSGKTLVAAAAAYAVVHARPPGRASGTLQVAYMAPTEILAQQHFRSFVDYFKHLPIHIALITGSGAWKYPSKVNKDIPTPISRAQLLKWVKNGEIAMLVGTHALIQKAVEFQHLAFVIIDEQHRFGTKQRRALAHKGDAAPHFLSMTATPIPRTLALTVYGDLELSVLDELPPGRAKVTTEIVQPKMREGAYEKIRAELQKGRQAYVICPRIEEPDPKKLNALLAKSAKAEAKRLQKEVFPEFRVDLLHGAMTAAEKERVMNSFTTHETDILVATSVVEVGINVPNATVIMIEGAERFGLAQLHQLRGRVQRSSHPPFCFLVPETFGETTQKRLTVLAKSSDGFELAEADLLLRGPGDLYGARQWGISDIGMEALKNPRLIAAAREEAFALVANDPELGNHPDLRTRLGHEEKLHRE